MKKYIPIDFDEKGKVILGREKNTPTQNGTIPAIFIPSGSDENKQGLKSISISPAIQTTPALDSLFPIYYGDGRIVGDEFTTTLSTDDELVQTVTVTITPTADVYVGADREGYAEFTNKGEARTFEIEKVVDFILLTDFFFCTSTDHADAVHLRITIDGSK